MNDPVVDSLFSGGLQLKRTALAWRRTSLSVLANGVLPLSTNLFDQNGPNQSITSGLAFGVALVACAVCRLRRRALISRPLPKGIAAKSHIYLLGVLVVALIGVIAAWLSGPDFT